jgi:hypothetical protein
MKALLIAAAVLLLVGVGAKSRFETSAAGEIPPVEIPSNLAQSDEVAPDFKLVLLALLPHGFETSEMELVAGEYTFIIGNRTGLKEVDLRLDREGQQRISAATLGGRQRDWKQRLKLTAGTYIVSANNNPEWTCRVEVKP